MSEITKEEMLKNIPEKIEAEFYDLTMVRKFTHVWLCYHNLDMKYLNLIINPKLWLDNSDWYTILKQNFDD